MARPTKYKHPLTHYAGVYGVDERTIKNWSKAGYPLDNEEKTKRLIQAQHRGPASINPDLAEAKRLKILREIEHIEWKLAKDQGQFISRAEVREQGVKIGSVLTAALNEFVENAPGMIAGMSEVDIRRKLAPKIEALKERIKQELSNDN